MDWGKIFSGCVGFAVALVLKLLLDFNLAIWTVKKLSWLPVRWLFRTKPLGLSGMWEHIWDFSEGTDQFKKKVDRHSHTELKQFHNYIYGEFFSRQVKYVVFGKIQEGGFVTGEWFNPKDKVGYFGTFELRIIDSNRMEGKWIGHSKSSIKINGDLWTWRKIIV